MREVLIKAQMREVLQASQGEPNPQVDNLFDSWKEAKSWFIQLLGEDLIYEVPEEVSFPISPEMKKNRWEDLVEDAPESLRPFLLKQGVNAFYENKVCCEWNEPEIPQGMKLIKAFKFFLQGEILRYWQDKASLLIQEDKVTGKLCFSVHPLDYLSLSENTYNWRSCHALDGEYRSGNLSYMTDSSTIVCYLRGEPSAHLPRFGSVSWNSKKWRMLLFFNPTHDAWLAGRQYPFFNARALDIVREVFVRDLLHLPLATWSHWHDDRVEPPHYKEHDYSDYCGRTSLNIGGDLYLKRDLISDGEGARNFNDLLHSSCYEPYYGWRKYFGAHPARNIHFTVGAKAPCIHCGEHPIAATDSMYCRYCEPTWGNSADEDIYPCCARCGTRGYWEDMIFYDMLYYCQDCYEETL